MHGDRPEGNSNWLPSPGLTYYIVPLWATLHVTHLTPLMEEVTRLYAKLYPRTPSIPISYVSNHSRLGWPICPIYPQMFLIDPSLSHLGNWIPPSLGLIEVYLFISSAMPIRYISVITSSAQRWEYSPAFHLNTIVHQWHFEVLHIPLVTYISPI